MDSFIDENALVEKFIDIVFLLLVESIFVFTLPIDRDNRKIKS